MKGLAAVWMCGATCISYARAAHPSAFAPDRGGVDPPTVMACRLQFSAASLEVFMPDQGTPKTGEDNVEQSSTQDEYVRGGKGRKDDVGHSGIYPASAPDAPTDAEVKTPGDFVHHSTHTEQDDDLIGAERLPRKGDDE
jgi:hypothetical protein